MIYFLFLSFLKHEIFVCLYIFRDPNRPVPVKMFWPLFTEEEQLYLHITRNMTSDSIKNHLLAREHNLWRNVIPRLMSYVKHKNEGASDYCRKDDDCSP